MKVFYYQRRDRVANYGDELNTWLWQQFLSEALAQTDDSVLVGLGTLLNDLLPTRLGKTGTVFIFSTGAGYEKPLRAIPPHWKLYCVRGPLTAQRLKVPAELAICDGAILLRRLVLSQAIAKKLESSRDLEIGSFEYPQGSNQESDRLISRKIAFMPHVHHATFAGTIWADLCHMAGFRYIDPRWSVEQVITAIQESQLLLAEAMHGAITADALGVPWIPITTSPRILSFKWQDWCASIRQPYQPVYLPPFPQEYPPYGRGARSGLRAATHWGRAIAQGNWISSTRWQEQIVIALKKIVKQERWFLSDRTHLENLTEALEQTLSQLRRDVCSTILE